MGFSITSRVFRVSVVEIGQRLRFIRGIFRVGYPTESWNGSEYQLRFLIAMRLRSHPAFLPVIFYVEQTSGTNKIMRALSISNTLEELCQYK